MAVLFVSAVLALVEKFFTRAEAGRGDRGDVGEAKCFPVKIGQGENAPGRGRDCASLERVEEERRAVRWRRGVEVVVAKGGGFGWEK